MTLDLLDQKVNLETKEILDKKVNQDQRDLRVKQEKMVSLARMAHSHTLSRWEPVASHGALPLLAMTR